MEATHREVQRRAAQVEFAGFWIRFVAYLVDGLVLNLIYSIVGLSFWMPRLGQETFFMSLAFNDPWSMQASPVACPNSLWALLALAIGGAYFAGFWQWRGQTPGKMVLGIKIIYTSGSSLSWGGALLRYLGYIVSAMILYIGFIY